MKIHSFTSGDLQDFGGESNRTLNMQLLVLGAIDEIAADYVTVSYDSLTRHVACVHFSKFLTLEEVRVIRILWILAGGTAPAASYSFSPLAT